MDIVEHRGSDDHGNRDGNGDGSGGRDDEHHGGVRKRDQSGSDADGDGGGVAVGDDRGGAEFDRGRTDGRVHGDRTL